MRLIGDGISVLADEWLMSADDVLDVLELSCGVLLAVLVVDDLVDVVDYLFEYLYEGRQVFVKAFVLELDRLFKAAIIHIVACLLELLN